MKDSSNVLVENIFSQFFICPQISEKYLIEMGLNWEKVFSSAMKSAKEILESKVVPKSFEKVTNFFYPLSPVFGSLRPKWAKKENLIISLSHQWIEFYHIP